LPASTALDRQAIGRQQYLLAPLAAGATTNRPGFAFARPLWQPEQRPVRELEMAAENLHLAFAAAPAFDH
jgi:hypothetical protein